MKTLNQAEVGYFAVKNIACSYFCSGFNGYFSVLTIISGTLQISPHNKTTNSFLHFSFQCSLSAEKLLHFTQLRWFSQFISFTVPSLSSGFCSISTIYV